MKIIIESVNGEINITESKGCKESDVINAYAVALGMKCAMMFLNKEVSHILLKHAYNSSKEIIEDMNEDMNEDNEDVIFNSKRNKGDFYFYIKSDSTNGIGTGRWNNSSDDLLMYDRVELYKSEIAIKNELRKLGWYE